MRAIAFSLRPRKGEGMNLNLVDVCCTLVLLLPLLQGVVPALLFTEGQIDFSLPFYGDSQKYPLKGASSQQDLSLNRHKIHLEG
jgi:hypothetical protein